MRKYRCCEHCKDALSDHVEHGGSVEKDGHDVPCDTCGQGLDVDRLTDLLMEHYPTQGVMASPTHWAYKKGWFAHCGTGHEDQKGCGWESKPDTYDNRMDARRAALKHVAEKITGLA